MKDNNQGEGHGSKTEHPYFSTLDPDKLGIGKLARWFPDYVKEKIRQRKGGKNHD